MASDVPTFEIVHDGTPGETLLAGFSEFGLAGLTAVDYLVDTLEFEQRGHVRASGVPSLTPFEGGVPRHHSRLFDSEDHDLTVLVGELFVPTPAANALGETLYDWVGTTPIEEVVVLSGVPFSHGPDAHKPFYIATPDYTERRIEGTDLTPMGRGYLDGVNGSFMSHGMETGIDTALFTTPAHAQTPDLEAALRLLDALTSAYDLELDTSPLESFAAEIAQHYQELAARLEDANEEQLPEDRMYM